LCRRSFAGCEVHIIRNDDLTFEQLIPHFPRFSAIVVGPGPGSPDKATDVGVLPFLWSAPNDFTVPIFGVCLGLQSLVLAHGGDLKRLHVVKHGQISRVEHSGKDIFQDVGDVHAVRYHSLHMGLPPSGEIEELAYADDGSENGHVVMAVRHRSKPFWAVQFHPESVKTHGGGLEVLQNFWRLAEIWSTERGRQVEPWTDEATTLFGPAWPSLRAHTPPSSPHDLPKVLTHVLDVSAPITVICELLGVKDESSPFVMLESAAKPGRFSIIGSLDSTSTRIAHYLGDAYVNVSDRSGGWHREHLVHARDVWSWIASFMRGRRYAGGDPDIPFWGGLVGSLSYELGVKTLGVDHHKYTEGRRRHPDVNLVYIERSVVVDAVSGRTYVQSLLPEDPWVNDIFAKIRGLSGQRDDEGLNMAPTSSAHVSLPNMPLYKSRIRACQDYLASGDSYELCLTARTRVELSPAKGNSGPSSWNLYKSTRKCNPAPHAAYLRLSPSTLVSSSPERFLSFSRPPGTTCQLRPIKGTLRKAPGVTRAVAEDALAGSAKEVAENLMIVDLIRHDLHGVVGDDVRVTAFCAIEEYETVWQMVSVIEGRRASGVHGPDLDAEGELGWEVLRRSLPPGEQYLPSL
jgi:para-aminobenzoate synthetase